MNNPDLFSESHVATYCPEDDKIRLYVGRVPRDEYEALRREGWTSTPKQDCDFVAVWTTEREDTALSYAGIILDEDQGPEDRAADRAERFGGYLDKRLGEAEGHADRYDAGPSVHGYQSQARAERAAARHDRIATRAVNAWEKAEYWQRRTAGVISHALHVSSPSVRMGRIKTIEAELRKAEKSWSDSTAEAQARFDSMQSVIDHAEGTREKLLAGRHEITWQLSRIREAESTPEDERSTPEQCRRALVAACLDHWHMSEANKARAAEAKNGTRPAAEIAREWLAENPRPEDFDPEKGTRYTRHLRHRLAYENQMIEAQGGRAAFVEMEPGGWIYGGRRISNEWRQIQKVNKSPKTGRVVSVLVKDNRPSSVNHWGNPYPEGVTKTLLHEVKTERLAENVYRAPTEEEKAAFLSAKAEAKKATPKKTAPPLINPTDEDAQRLQDRLNALALADHCARHQRAYGRDYADQFKPSTVSRITQQVYSANSRGSYAVAETRGICKGGEMEPRASNMYCRSDKEEAERRGPALCQIRAAQGDGSTYGARRVIVLTDKPQKPLPLAVWPEHVTEEAPQPEPQEIAETPTPAAELSPVIAGAMETLANLTQAELFA